MKEKIKKILNNKVFLSIIVVLAVAVLLIVVPICINELYIKDKGYETLWGAQEVLAFYGAVLSFIGSLFVGGVAIYQNKKAFKLASDSQKMNEKLAKLEQAQFISMVSVEKLMILSADNLNQLNLEMKEPQIINLSMNEVDKEKHYLIDVCFKNHSNYPIVQMNIRPYSKEKDEATDYMMNLKTEVYTYIEPGASKNYRFAVPRKMYEDLNEYYYLLINLRFTNIFDYFVKGSLYIPDLRNKNKKNNYQYRLVKFIDVRVKSDSEK